MQLYTSGGAATHLLIREAVNREPFSAVGEDHALRSESDLLCGRREPFSLRREVIYLFKERIVS